MSFVMTMLWNSWVFIAACWFTLVSSNWDPAANVKAVINVLDKSDLERPQPKLPMELDKLQYHGTTTLSFIHDGCVILCIDSKASVGNYVGSRCVKKIFPVSKSIVATMAGGAADCAYWIRRIATAAKGIEYRYAAKLNAGAIARMLASSLREYRGMDLSVGTMVAGYEENVGPSLYYVDSDGACIEGDMFCVGSGAQFAYAVLDTATGNNHDAPRAETVAASLGSEEGGALLSSAAPSIGADSAPTGLSKKPTSRLAAMPLEEAIETAVRAVRHATFRDAFSGGYINVLVVNATGIHHIRRVDSKTIRMES